jgi:hypothetical protein
MFGFNGVGAEQLAFLSERSTAPILRTFSSAFPHKCPS